MATISAARATHATLTTTTADEVTLTAPLAKVQIVNLDISTPMYATAVGNGGTPTTAVSEADDTYVIPGNGVLTLRTFGDGFVASVVGSGNEYAVVGYQHVEDDLTFTGSAT